MKTETYLTELVDHMAWADAEIWRAVVGNKQVAVDDQVRELLHHIHVVQQVYYQMWAGKEIRYPDLPEFQHLKEMLEWSSEYSIKITELVGIMDELEFDLVLHNPWKESVQKSLGVEPREATIGQSIIQVATHSGYHRGQINSRIRELHCEPAGIDFITWVWLDKPKPQWNKIYMMNELESI